MSFEGYYQILCKGGHLDQCDIHSMPEEKDAWHCGYCGEGIGWSNIVDLTNGSWDEKGNRIDGWLDLEVREVAVKCVCPDCCDLHIKEPAKYNIPYSVQLKKTKKITKKQL